LVAAAEGTIVLTRSAAVTRVLARVLAANLAVAFAKLTFGYATATVSIISDGFHSLTDAAANVVALVGLRASGKPPDVDHPYGHRKFETLTAGAIVALLVLAIAEVVRTSLQHLGGASAPRVTGASFAVMIATLVVNLVVVAYERRAAARLTSELLLADAMHTRSDVLTSLGVLVSLVGVWLGFPILDPLSGLVVAMVIGHTGFQIGRSASHILADRIVMPEEDLRAVVMAVPGVLGCHHIRTRGTADHVFLDMHVWMRADARLDDAHRLSHVVKDRLMNHYPQIVDAIIHIEPPPGPWHGGDGGHGE
jgi:cation diffusion facilitator family transporter